MILKCNVPSMISSTSHAVNDANGASNAADFSATMCPTIRQIKKERKKVIKMSRNCHYNVVLKYGGEKIYKAINVL